MHGLKSPLIEDKLSDKEFIQKLGNSDNLTLTKLHTDRKDLSIPGYTLKKVKLRPKTHKGSKISGGIALFVNESLGDSVHVVPNTNENSIWVEIKNESNKKESLFVGSFYVSPESMKIKVNLFELLNEEIKKFQNKGSIILQGDFNAQVGKADDFITPDPFFNNMFDGCPTNSTQSIPPRNSEDTKSNSRGDELLDFCKNNEFAIVNGRKVGDLFGKYTSHQYNGSSAVDFVLTPIVEFEKISYLEVGDFTPWLSDHTPFSKKSTKNTNQSS